jgi:DNA-directed RNA polymerase subunit RPC12/RpoP
MTWFRVSEKVRAEQKKLARAGQTDRLHYCYRCFNCGRLITKLELLEAWGNDQVNPCPCGSRKIRITNPKKWEELLLPRCWRLIFAIYTKQIAPPPPPPSPQEQADARRLARAALRADPSSHVRVG